MEAAETVVPSLPDASAERPVWEAEALRAAAERAERQSRMLQELAEIGMELARALRDRVRAGGEEAAVAAGKTDPAKAFQEISRAVRLTLALEEKIDADLRALRSDLTHAIEEHRRSAEAAAARAREAALENKRKEFDSRIHVVSCREAYGLDDEPLSLAEDDPRKELQLAVYEAIGERLADHEAYADHLDRPIEETLERICRDLGLNADCHAPAPAGWFPEVRAKVQDLITEYDLGRACALAATIANAGGPREPDAPGPVPLQPSPGDPGAAPGFGPVPSGPPPSVSRPP